MNEQRAMKCIGGARACGKTTALIEQANKEWLYIVCADRHRAHHIATLAKHLEFDIPFPVTVAELPLKSHHIKEVLVDDAETVLDRLIGKTVITMTTSLQMEVREHSNE